MLNFIISLLVVVICPDLGEIRAYIIDDFDL